MVKRRIKVVDYQGIANYLQQKKICGFWITVGYSLSEFTAREWLVPSPPIPASYIYPPIEVTVEGPM